MKAFITGISGQDGSYLAELLLSKGYEVHGLVRRHSVAETQSSRINHIFKDLTLHYGDMTDFSSLLNIVKEIQPDEIYNLAAQSHVKVSEETPIYTAQADALGVINLLEIVGNYPCRMYQASTSEMFGNQKDTDGFQRETTPMKPVSPYGASKLFAHNLCNHYRHAYELHISCGILFNHTSPRRGETFVEQKIVKGLCKFKEGGEPIELGLLSPTRDIGYAPEYVEAMWLMLQQENPDDYVIATGQSKSIADILSYVCHRLMLKQGDCVKLNTKYNRAQELFHLKGDASKALYKLGWKPRKKLNRILDEMIAACLPEYKEVKEDILETGMDEIN